MSIEQVRDASTPQEMRMELHRMASCDPLVRAIFDTSYYNGMNAEDKYTMLAYQAMKHRNELLEMSIRNAELSTKIVYIVQNPGDVI
jgi:hypothetical protein